VDSLVAAADPALPDGELRAVVAPHAGYVYSGAVAATAFAAIRSRPGRSRVVLLGPSHFIPLSRAAVSGADAWLTPLGPVPVDDDLRSVAVAAGAFVDDEPHEVDHALEVELPFLQRVVGDSLRALPIAVGGGRGAAAVVAAVGDDALIVVSTDLSHYHDDATARRLDRGTADAVVALDAAAIGDDDACGAGALRGLVLHARQAGWTATVLALDTSAAAARDAQRVVGYGAFAFVARRAAA
jgi:AmmeMemoRadiSam system protein B